MVVLSKAMGVDVEGQVQTKAMQGEDLASWECRRREVNWTQ